MKLSDIFDIHVGKVCKPSDGDSLPIIMAGDIPDYGFMSKPMKEWHSSSPPGLASTEECGRIFYPFDIIFDPISFKAGLVGWRGINAYMARTNLWILRSKSNPYEGLSSAADVFIFGESSDLTDVERGIPELREIIEIFMYLRSSKGQSNIAMEASGKAVKKITPSRLAALNIPLEDEFQTEKVVNGFYEEMEIYKRLHKINNIFGTIDSISPSPNTMCSFCKKHVATEYVARWDTWKTWGKMRWLEPACSQCAPLNKQTWLT